MISGSVNAHREAAIKIEIRDGDGNSHFLNAMIDTGFNRFLGLPLLMIDALGLHKSGWEVAELGDGSIRRLDTYKASVMWDGSLRLLVVHETDSCPLIGMELLDGHELHIQVVPGGTVTVEAIT